jgi:xanthine/uracil permease
MRHLHRIVAVPIGTNIMGLLDILVSIGILWGIIYCSSFSLGMFIKAIVIIGSCIGTIGIIAFDLWFRNRQPESKLWIRLLSPFTGGCFLYVPIWLLFPLCLVTTIIIGAVHKLNH